jgi:hypothetical protein
MDTLFSVSISLVDVIGRNQEYHSLEYESHDSYLLEMLSLIGHFEAAHEKRTKTPDNFLVTVVGGLSQLNTTS